MEKANIRIRLTKPDYYKLVEQYNKNFNDNLFGKTPTNDKDLIKKSTLKIIAVEFEGTKVIYKNKVVGQDTIYFGWNNFNWNPKGENISFIKTFVEEQSQGYSLAYINCNKTETHSSSRDMPIININYIDFYEKIKLEFDDDNYL